ncbi:hypothetical protein LUZ63_014460 [Rhynchospora breviuscula]|uniref:PUM-HD domain-containing protein n=1 Tax=Rhynchospora breviuscula TaxID=2022672 RepID=A0A9Q0CAQ8_9POAL|nr:hypothetical protein LUZ63_014460 [Rhynchospora breviuscula]
MVTESPLAILSEIAMRDRDLDLFRSGSTPPRIESNGNGSQDGAPNGSCMEGELWSDPAYHSYYYANANHNPRLPPPALSREEWRSAYRLSSRISNGGSLSDVGGVREGRRLNQDGLEGYESGFGGGDGLIGLPSLEMGQHNGFGEIFQDAFSYPNPSPAAGLHSSVNNANYSASSNVSGSSTSNNYGSILGSPLSRSGTPDPEVLFSNTPRRVPSPGLPPIGVKLNSIDRSMTTNGSSMFSNGSVGMDQTDQIVSALSGLNIQSGTADSCRSSISPQADQSNIMRSYLDLYRDNNIHSPDSRNFMHLLENAYTGLNVNGTPGLLNHRGNGSPTSLQMPVDPRYIEFMRMELLRLQQKKQQQYAHYADLGFIPGYTSDSAFPSSPTGNLIRPGDWGLMRSPSGLRKLSSFGNVGGHIPTLLEEFKSNKTRCYELSEIAGHVVEFSSDQYGSRFIQQKLETATTAEKDMVFEEIMPCAVDLMTDVFGNYVVQKFFEHGSASQIKELAEQLNGRVLVLSLQMYGCRVIQKAIEVVDLEQKTQMVAELDGHVMRCVRDQNGNHVIQKCIECVPQDIIHFIISTFYGQVLVLSTHAYGCRVIQRVLEHCDNPKTQQIMMDEILKNVLLLSQDQYGNYVVQHVLEHGKPNERSAIIEELAGQIVNMSRQKYASNVVEKCLSFGTPVERQILIAEMLGPTEENEALQEMMKDQYGNYVVQKVLETCSDQQREMILTRIKIHLTALKKYTYGKHIVARVEKLVAAGGTLLLLPNNVHMQISTFPLYL